MNPILQLLTTGDTGGSKQDVWNNAVDMAIKTAKGELVKYIDDLLDEDSGGMLLVTAKISLLTTSFNQELPYY